MKKNKTSNNMILTEINQTVTGRQNDLKICQIFNTYFTIVTKSLKLRQVNEYQSKEAVG